MRTLRHIERSLGVAALITLQGCASGPRPIWSVASPDRAHRLELVEDGDRQWVSIDGRPGPAARAIAPMSVLVSPDGGHLAYVEVIGEQARVVRDGCAGPRFEGVAELAFDPSGENLAYVAESRGRFRVIRDGKAGLARQGVLEATLRFSPDSKHLFYVEGGPPYRVVIDETPGPSFDGVARLSVRRSDTGPSYAYLGRRAGATYVVTEQRETGPFQAVSALVRDPSSGLTAWVVEEPDRAVVYRDGAPVDSRFVSIRGLSFQPGGSALAYVGLERGKALRVVHAGRTHGPYDEVSALSFSEDGRRFGYAALRGKTWDVVVDGRVVARETFSGPPVFSPDGARMGRLVHRNGRAYAIVDQRAHALGAVILGTLAFSRDSRHFALIAGDRERRRLFAFVDGREGPRVEFAELTVGTLKALAGSAPPDSEFAILLEIARAEAERASRSDAGARLAWRGCSKPTAPPP